MELFYLPHRPMDSQAATPSSLSEESCTLDLPMVCDSMGYEASQGASQGSDSTSLSSLEPHPFPSSSTADSGNIHGLHQPALRKQ